MDIEAALPGEPVGQVAAEGVERTALDRERRLQEAMVQGLDTADSARPPVQADKSTFSGSALFRVLPSRTAQISQPEVSTSGLERESVGSGQYLRMPT